MLEFKLEKLRAARPGASEPAIEPMDPHECLALQRALARKWGLAKGASERDILAELLSRCTDLGMRDVRSSGFRLTEDPGLAAIAPGTRVTFSEGNTEGLERGYSTTWGVWVKHLAHLWYPSSDDMIILAADLTWGVMITHYGAVHSIDLGM